MREEERQLIRRLASGDQAAINEFGVLWYERIVDWVAYQADPQRVGDYAHDVWRHLMEDDWHRLLQWNGLFDDETWHPQSLQGFLHEVTDNRVTDLLRAEIRQPPSGLDPVDIMDIDGPLGRDPQVRAERARLMLAFLACSDRYNDRDKRLVILWLKGYTAKEIAEQLEMKPNNVHQRKSYLFSQLRDCLVDKLPEYFRHV